MVQGNSLKESYEKDGKVSVEFLVMPTYMTSVDHNERTFSQATCTEWHGGWQREPLAFMRQDAVEFRLTTDRGLVFRTNPPVTQARVVVEGKTETLVASVKRKDGKVQNFTLSRDARTKLPIQFRTVIDDGKPAVADFAFERREVFPFELAIDAEGYQGYREVPLRSGSSG